MKLLPEYRLDRAMPWLRQRNACAAAILFCVSTFAVSAFRASLNPDQVFDLFDLKRIVLIIAGALVFWLAIAGRGSRRPGLPMLRRMAVVGLPGLVLLLLLAVGYDMVIAQDTTNMAAINLRWMLLWSGYFGTGLAAWLAVQYGAALAEVEQQAAEPSPVPERRSHGDSEGFWVKTGRSTVLIPTPHVEWIEAEGNYVRVHALDGGHGLIRSTLQAIESQLPEGQFIRVHRSALCRRTAIQGYRRKPSGAMLALLASGAEAPIGRRFAQAVIVQSQGVASHVSGMDDTVSPPGTSAHAT